MGDIKNTRDLKARIEELEYQKAAQEAQLQEDLYSGYESLKPANLVRTVFSEIVETPELIQDILTNLMSLASGYVSSKLIFRKSKTAGKKVLATVLQYGLTYYVASHAQEIKEKAKAYYHAFFKKEKQQDRPPETEE